MLEYSPISAISQSSRTRMWNSVEGNASIRIERFQRLFSKDESWNWIYLFQIENSRVFSWNIKKVERLHFSAKLQWVMLSAERAQERVWLAKSSSSFSAVKFCTSAPFKTLHSAFVFWKKKKEKYRCIFQMYLTPKHNFYSFRIGRFVFLTIKQIENPCFLPIYRKYKVTKNRSNSSTQSDYYCMRENAYNIILCGRRKTPFFFW